MGKFLLMGKHINEQVLANGQVLAHGSGPPGVGVGWGVAGRPQGPGPEP